MYPEGSTYEPGTERGWIAEWGAGPDGDPFNETKETDEPIDVPEPNVIEPEKQDSPEEVNPRLLRLQLPPQTGKTTSIYPDQPPDGPPLQLQVAKPTPLDIGELTPIDF
jgi:hypothetical protein